MTPPTHLIETDETDGEETDVDTSDYYVSPAEGRRLFDEATRELMGMSGEEFIRRWEAGDFWEIADQEGNRHIVDLILAIPFARQES